MNIVLRFNALFKDFRFLCLLVSFIPGTIGAQVPNDSFPFIRNDLNYILYGDPSLVSRLADYLNGDTTRRKVIAHFGDSHIQPDYLPAVLRANLQLKYGNGGRGMIFPYSIARTYSQNDYKSTYTGVWRSANSIQMYPRIPLGVSGFVAATSDPDAGFTFTFKKSMGGGEHLLKIYTNPQITGYKMLVESDNIQQVVFLDSSSVRDNGLTTLRFSSLGDTIRFRFIRESGFTNELMFYGVSIEKPSGGLIYHNLGVGGAAFCALNNQVHFARHVQQLNPGVYILDWGTNDILYKNRIAPDFESTVYKTIRKVRETDPDAIIVLTSAMDMNFKGKNITSARQLSWAMQQIADSANCLYYNWYEVSGGSGAMKKWERESLGRKDNIHLTRSGYELKGRLFSEAISNTLEFNKSYPDSSLHFTESNLYPYTVGASEIQEPQPDKFRYHKVKSGQTLSVIAAKYQVSVAVIRKINGLKGNTIRRGQVLKIPVTYRE